MIVRQSMFCYCRIVTVAGTLAFLFSFLAAHATTDETLQLQLGNPSNATVDPANHTHFLISRTVDVVDLNDTLGLPNWASWDLTGSDIGTAGRSTSFYKDTLPTGFDGVISGDYTNSGFDRGHLCPSYDRTDLSVNNKLVFYLTNIMPQTPDNNQGVWERFESFCQQEAQSGCEVLLIAGPSLYTGATTQPSGRVAIPGYTWKIAVFVPAGSGPALSRITATTRVVALKVPNIAGVRSDPWGNYVTSASQIEADTGLKFFTALPTCTAAVLRAKVDGAVVPVISGFTPVSGVVGSSVTVFGSGFGSATCVAFGETTAAFTIKSDTEISVNVPTGAASGEISVLAPGGTIISASRYNVLKPTPQPTATPEPTMTPEPTASPEPTAAPEPTAVPEPTAFPDPSPSNPGGVVISQVYGGGGAKGAAYKNDFIELYNPSSTAVDLDHYAVQYATAFGSNWSLTKLSGSIPPGRFYLIREGGGARGIAKLPLANASGNIDISARAGKIALTKTQRRLNMAQPQGLADVADFVGYGTANAYEGAGAAPAISPTTAALRAGNGATDRNNNEADFSAGAPSPHR